jgi:hypothetical protein
MGAPRRVVTGHDAAGRAIVLSDGPAPRFHAFEHVDGMETATIWASSPNPRDSQSDPTLTLERHVPASGETRFAIVTFPPDSVFAQTDFDPRSAADEQLAVSPDLAALFELGSPGMHTTPSLDYAVVVSGRIRLELDDGVGVDLAAGDTVVQQWTRHAWRNPWESPAIVAFVNLGRTDKLA